MSMQRSQLDEWLRSAKATEESVMSEIAERQRVFEESIVSKREELARTREMIRLIDGLLSLTNGGTAPNGRSDVRKGRGSGGDQAMGPIVTGTCYEVLKAEGQPLFYKDLAERLLASGVVINSKDPATYVIAYIGRDERFVRSGRGMYALAEWGLKPIARTRRAKVGRGSKGRNNSKS